MAKLRLLWQAGQPWILVPVCLLTLAGAALSPAFLTPAVPYSAARALGAATVAGLLWYGIALLSLRPGGPLTGLLTGCGATLALTFGLKSQSGVTEVGFLAAVALGQLAGAISLIAEFRDIEGDRAARRSTLPVLLGRRGAVYVNLAAVAAASLTALYLLIQTIGVNENVMVLFALPVTANLYLLARLADETDPAYARRACRLAVILFMAVTALYVGAQALS